LYIVYCTCIIFIVIIIIVFDVRVYNIVKFKKIIIIFAVKTFCDFNFQYFHIDVYSVAVNAVDIIEKLQVDHLQ